MRRPALPTVPCQSCHDGLVPGPKAGETLRREREERDVPRTALARHFKRPDKGFYSESYVIDLEFGARPLTWALVEAYRAAIEAAVKERLNAESPEALAGR